MRFTTSLPAVVSGSTEKYLLKEAVQDMLPWQVIERPKSGMLVPVEAWFTGRQRRWARERLLDGLAPYGLFRRDYLQELLPRRGPSKGRKPGAKIWMLLFLEAWMRTHRVRSPFQVDGA